MTGRERIYALAGALLIAAWFLYFAGEGLWAPFTADDLMNLHGYLSRPFGSLLLDNLRYWSTAFRPLGGLFYVPMYRLFGFHPLPYRLACFALLGINMALLFRFCRRLSGSREVAFFAVFLASFNGWFLDLYYNTGTIYCLLCYAFFFSALTLYVNARRSGKPLSARQMAGLLVLYICALNAKEMAVTLPLFLLLYEAIWHAQWRPRRLPMWLLGEGRGVLVTGLLTAIYVVGKLSGPDSLVRLPAYHLSISPVRYLHAFHIYLNFLLYRTGVFHDSNTLQLMAAMLALAIWRRSRTLLFAWCFLLLSPLPVAFIGHMAAFLWYIPMAGWALYAATVLVMLRQYLVRLLARWRWRGQGMTWASRAALLLALAVLLAPLHIREKRKSQQVYAGGQSPVQETTAGLLAIAPQLPPGAHVLFVGDPFRTDQFFLLFLTRLVYGDMRIAVDRTSVRPVPFSDYARYDRVFQFHDGRLRPAPAPI